MTKNVKTLAACLLLLGAVSCQSAAEKEKEKSMMDNIKSASDRIDAPKKDVQFNQEIVLDDAKVKVSEPQILDEAGEKVTGIDSSLLHMYYSKAATGKKFIAFTIEEYEKKNDHIIYPKQLISPDGKTYELNADATVNFTVTNLEDKNKGLDKKVHAFEGEIFEIDEAEWNKPGWKLAIDYANIISVK